MFKHNVSKVDVAEFIHSVQYIVILKKKWIIGLDFIFK